MLWFNNHSWDQENLYAEARQMMKEQRRLQRQQERQTTAEDEDGLSYLIAIIAIVAFLITLYNTLNLGLSIAVLFIVAIVGAFIPRGKSSKSSSTRSKKSSDSNEPSKKDATKTQSNKE